MRQTQAHSQGRIPCPRCQANNFLGQPQCWQCGGSLPPPEAMASRFAARPAFGFSRDSGGRTIIRVPSRLLRWVLVLGACGLAFWGVLRWMGGSPSAPTSRLPLADRPSFSRLSPPPAYPSSRLTMPPADTSPVPSEDPVMSQARREIERARGTIEGIPETPAASSPDGQFRLRTGGSLRAEDVEAAKRALRSSPLLQEPPPPPPF